MKNRPSILILCVITLLLAFLPGCAPPQTTAAPSPRPSAAPSESPLPTLPPAATITSLPVRTPEPAATVTALPSRTALPTLTMLPSPTHAPAALPTLACDDKDTLQISNTTNEEVELQLSGTAPYVFYLKAGENTLEICTGQYAYTAYGCGGIATGTMSTGETHEFYCK